MGDYVVSIFNKVTSMRNETIEKFLHKTLLFYFIIVFAATAIGAFNGYSKNCSWRVGDWLINYQGGMVRRGLLGELIYNLANITHLNPGYYAIIFQLLFYAIFFLIYY